LSALLAQQNAGTLTSEEKQELAALMHIYEQGLLLKAQALQAAVQRELLEPDSNGPSKIKSENPYIGERLWLRK
jgi:hypothetical protein